MSDIKTAVYVKEETVMQSIYKDFVTLVMVAFSVYISQGSTFWTFVTGLMFILFMFLKIKSVMDKGNYFKTKAELQKWVNDLPDV